MDYQISYACMSHIGRRRRMNQDNFLCGGIYAKPDQPGRGRAPITGSVTSAQTSLFGVFDGMGGEERGEMASYLAAKAAFSTLRSGTPRQTLEAVCQNANLDICHFIEENGLGTCGTTAAMLLLTAKRVQHRRQQDLPSQCRQPVPDLGRSPFHRALRRESAPVPVSGHPAGGADHLPVLRRAALCGPGQISAVLRRPDRHGPARRHRPHPGKVPGGAGGADLAAERAGQRRKR